MGRWRKQVHMALVLCALLLRWLPFVYIVAAAVGALAFNVWVLPRLTPVARALYRDMREGNAISGGIIMYPTSVLLAVVFFPLPIAAAAWGFLAIGDGMAAFVGERVSQRPWPWHARKTPAGTLALFVFGVAAAAGLFLWTRMNTAGSPPVWQGTELLRFCQELSFAGVGARVAIVGAIVSLVESLPLTIDDNVSVTLLSAIGLLVACMV